MIPHPSRASSPRLGGSQPHTCSPRPAPAPALLSDVPELLPAVACTLQSFPAGRLLSAETQPFSPAGPVAAEQKVKEGIWILKKIPFRHRAVPELEGVKHTFKPCGNEQNYLSASIFFVLGLHQRFLNRKVCESHTDLNAPW